MNAVNKIINLLLLALFIIISILPLLIFMDLVMDIRIGEQYGDLTSLGFSVCVVIWSEAYVFLKKLDGL